MEVVEVKYKKKVVNQTGHLDNMFSKSYKPVIPPLV